MYSDFLITKKSGEQVNFDINKLRNSLQRAGAKDKTIDAVLIDLEPMLQNGMSTHTVYKLAYRLLSKISHRSAGRYRLKNAIMELGPTGYPFEKFVGAILQNQGYEAKTGQIIHGKCVQHEVDVVAEDDKKIIVVECKFHREGNRKSDVKIPLYIRSRFNDIEDKWKQEGRIGDREFEGWLVTNTRFTEDAEQYGKCSGLKLISWDYPRENSLRNLVDQSGLHPITSLKNLSSKEKQVIIDSGIVLCRELTQQVLEGCGIVANKHKKILQEAQSLVEL
jgi:hypothetical protein